MGVARLIILFFLLRRSLLVSLLDFSATSCGHDLVACSSDVMNYIISCHYML